MIGISADAVFPGRRDPYGDARTGVERRKMGRRDERNAPHPRVRIMATKRVAEAKQKDIVNGLYTPRRGISSSRCTPKGKERKEKGVKEEAFWGLNGETE